MTLCLSHCGWLTCESARCFLGPLIGGPESGTSLGEPACAKSMSWD